MEIKRNAPCPCGSGKKYKKCCANKKDEKQLAQSKIDRYQLLKQQLSSKLNNYVHTKVTKEIKEEFNQQLTANKLGQFEKTIFQHWVNFIYRNTDGKRFVETFYDVKSSSLSYDERALLNEWVNQKPQFIQMVNRTDEGIIVEDILTNKEYFITNMDAFDTLPPWSVTLAMLDAYADNQFVLNGIAVWQNPMIITELKQKINDLKLEEGINNNEVLSKYYLAFLSSIMSYSPQKKVTEVIYSYDILEKEQLLNAFENNESIVKDQQNEERTIYTVLGDWFTYEDSAATQQIQVAPKLAEIHVNQNQLKLFTFVEGASQQFSKWLSNLSVKQSDTKTREHTISQYANGYTIGIKAAQETNEDFVLFAQERFLVENPECFDLPKMDLTNVELKLRQLEYEVAIKQRATKSSSGETADFNSIRIKYSLPMSPFVTGGPSRRSSLVKDVEAQEGNTNEITEDLMVFFKEKTEGKSDATISKYRSSLKVIEDRLTNSNLTNWVDLKGNTLADLRASAEGWSQHKMKSYHSTLNALIKWLASTKDIKIN
jgi:uncharacterized protein YecA (UPF0149 family)